MSERPGEPKETFDIRHPEFQGLKLLPEEKADRVMMPILLKMVRSGLIAPAATSVRDQEGLIVYFSCSFAEKLDVEAQTGKFVWADVEYGSDITQTVTDALQASFVQ